MSEQFDNLELRLNRLRLRPISAGVEQRIADELDETVTGKSTCPCHPEMEQTDTQKSAGRRHLLLADARWSRPRDRWLWSAITSGAIAACVIVAMLITDAQSDVRAVRLPIERHMQPANSSGIALASAGQTWGDELGFALHRSNP